MAIIIIFIKNYNFFLNFLKIFFLNQFDVTEIITATLIANGKRIFAYRNGDCNGSQDATGLMV